MKRLLYSLGVFFAAVSPLFAVDSVGHNYPSCRQCIESNAHVVINVHYSGLTPGAGVRVFNATSNLIAQFTTSGTGAGTYTHDNGIYDCAGLGYADPGNITSGSTSLVGDHWGYVVAGGSFPVTGGREITYSMDAPGGCPGSCPSTSTNEVSIDYTIGDAPCMATFLVTGGACPHRFQAAVYGGGTIDVTLPGDHATHAYTCAGSVGDAFAAQVDGAPAGSGNLPASGTPEDDCPGPISIDVSRVVCPTPTPSPTPTATPRFTPTPTPGATATPTPHPGASPGVTPPVVVGPNGAVGQAVIVENPADIYNPIVDAVNALPKKADIYDAVLSALQDSGNGYGPPQNGHSHVWDRPDDDLAERGHLDDVQGQVDELADNVDEAQGNLVDKISSLQDAVSTLPTSFGFVTALNINMGTFLPGAPASIDLTPFLGIIGIIRSILSWLITISFFWATIGAFTYEE